jgi:DNA recombination protein RmuC
MEYLIAVLLGGVLVALLLLLRNSQALIAGLGRRDGDAGSLSEAASAIRERLAEVLTMLRSRQEVEGRTAESIRHLEMVIAGTQSKGAAGENIIDAVFAQLPPDWQVRNFRVANKVVEFGLRLPNNLILPIDSKWPATNLTERFLECDQQDERRRIKVEIERAVLNKAREVRRYLDPNVTVDFGIAAVPDAVFDLCSSVQCEALQMNVVLVGYSMFVPYLLLVFQMALKTSHDIDLEKLAAYLRDVEASVAQLQEEVDGRLARAITMLTNSRNDMTQHLGRITSRLTGVQLHTAESPAVRPDLVELDSGEDGGIEPIRAISH